MSEREACIRLALTDGLGPVGYKRLTEQFGSASGVLRAPASRLGSLAGAVGRASRISLAGMDLARVITRADSDYPPRLADTYDPPVMLWYRGRRPEPARPRVAMVGTRKATAYGRRVAADLARALSDYGVEVISGLALGIDGAAHRGALEGRSGTTAVLGCGVDRVFPALHRSLAAQVERHGTLLSEFPPGTPARAGHFPRRNRIISGLADALIVVEAGIKGGATLTARLAESESRPVYAVPGDIGRASSAGTNSMLQSMQANAIVDAEWMVSENWPGLLSSAPDAASAGRGPSPPREAGGAPADRLFAGLGREPRPLDQLCQELNMDISTALVELLQLELAGRVRQYPGKQFALA